MFCGWLDVEWMVMEIVDQYVLIGCDGVWWIVFDWLCFEGVGLDYVVLGVDFDMLVLVVVEVLEDVCYVFYIEWQVEEVVRLCCEECVLLFDDFVYDWILGLLNEMID